MASQTALQLGCAPLPRLPPELLLEIFSYLDRPTLSALHLSNLVFFYLIAPFFYKTAHFDDLLHLITSLFVHDHSKDMLHFALGSVRTLHLTIQHESPPRRILPRVLLPYLDHLFLHWQHVNSENDVYCDDLPLTRCCDFLSHLNPLSITISTSGLYSSGWHDWAEVEPHTALWTSKWTRLEDIVFFGASLYEFSRQPTSADAVVVAFLPHTKEIPVTSTPPRVTYDLRTVISEGEYHDGWPDWLFDMGDRTVYSTILVLTSSQEEQRSLQEEVARQGFDQMETGWSRKPKGRR